MPDFQLDIAIQRPPDEVFAYLTDFDRQPEWQPGVLASSHTPPGPPRIGTRVRKLRKTPMGRVSFTDEVTEFDPAGRSYAERVVDSMIRGSGSRWSVAASGDGTRLIVSVHVEAVGVWMVMQPFIARSTRKDIAAALARLRAVLEAPVGQHHGTI